MKTLRHLLLPSLLSLTPPSLWADTILPTPSDDYNGYSQQTSENTKSLAKYLLNLGGYLGYNLTQSATTGDSSVSQQLLNAGAAQVTQTLLFYTALGAIPVNTLNATLQTFVPEGSYSAINKYANASFGNAYKTVSGKTVSVSDLIDQSPYQQDPVSQSLLNILSTPNDSYCAGSKPTSAICRSKVITNVIGLPLPGPDDFFGTTYNSKFLSQLNGNVLLAPLMYTTANTNDSGASDQGSDNTNKNGLPAETQAQQAADFIRYATASIVPLMLSKKQEYEQYYTQQVALLNSQNLKDEDKIKAQNDLATYLANLRVFTAQSSVVFSNFYYFLSKRMPQNLTTEGSDQQNVSSQALNEFKLATWRLFNPEQTDLNKQWIAQINQASAATVQKEIAILLAEINYQMYLSRQQDERLLFTATMQLQNSRGLQPSLSSVKHSSDAANNDD